MQSISYRCRVFITDVRASDLHPRILASDEPQKKTRGTSPASLSAPQRILRFLAIVICVRGPSPCLGWGGGRRGFQHGIILERRAVGNRRNIALLVSAAVIATRASAAAGPMAVTVAGVVAIGRIADPFAPVSAAATRTAPGAAIEQAPDPPQGMEAEVALAAAFIAALAAAWATTAASASAASVAVVGVDALTDRTTNRPASRTAVAVARTATLATAASSAISLA
jgi:hypothetical protein